MSEKPNIQINTQRGYVRLEDATREELICSIRISFEATMERTQRAIREADKHLGRIAYDENGEPYREFPS